MSIDQRKKGLTAFLKKYNPNKKAKIQKQFKDYS